MSEGKVGWIFPNREKKNWNARSFPLSFRDFYSDLHVVWDWH